MKDEIKSIVTIIEEVCEDVCENYCEYRNTIDDYGEKITENGWKDIIDVFLVWDYTDTILCLKILKTDWNNMKSTQTPSANTPDLQTRMVIRFGGMIF